MDIEQLDVHGERMKIVYVSIQSLSAEMFSAIVEEGRGIIGKDAEAYAYNYSDLNDNPLLYHDLKKRTAEADFVIVRCMSDPCNLNRFIDYVSALESSKAVTLVYVGNVEIRKTYRHLFKRNDEEYETLCRYLTIKGKENENSVLAWMKSIYDQKTPVLRPVTEVNNTGLYHSGALIDDPDSFIREVSKDNVLRIGIVFDANCWIYNDLKSINTLITRLESMGMKTIPILFSNMVSKGHSLYRSSEDVLTRYFSVNGEAIIDAAIICTGFSLLVNSKPSGTGLSTNEADNYLKNILNVPVIHALTVRTFKEFSEEVKGLEKSELFTQVVWPEVDGQIISVPFAMSDPCNKGMTIPINERIDHLCRLTKGWASLRSTPVSERRVAILMYQSSNSLAGIGQAGGLDTVESVARILNSLESQGYNVGNHPQTGEDLVSDLQASVTNDLTCISDPFIEENAIDLIDETRYRTSVYDDTPGFDRISMEKSWGKPVGEIQTSCKKMVIPGTLYGNIFIGYQPPRALAEIMDQVMHDPDIVIPHQYLEYYHWLQYDLHAQVVIHMGTHGSIEWLPGKSVGLSQSCFPDLTLDSLPHMYPYLINDPGEGIQTKRRTEAVVIGHMSPPMGLAGQDGDLNRLENLVQEYLKCRRSVGDDRRGTLLSMILEEIRDNNLDKDLSLPEDCTCESLEADIERVNDYLFDLRENIIRTGLHILGEPVRGLHKDEEIYSIMRLRNEGHAPLRETVFAMLGLDSASMEKDPSDLFDESRTNGEVLSEISNRTMDYLRLLRDSDYDNSRSEESAKRCFGAFNDELAEISSYICDSLSVRIDRTTDEMTNLLVGFDGGFVPSGPSGAPTRSGADILPTGRNFYTIDPESAPTEVSWETGRRMADAMINRFVEEKGAYPRDVGFIMWATDNMKTNGDDIAYVLWLMGVKPVRSPLSGRITGLEVVPLEELGRPRIDVTIRITGLFRDTFPNSVDLIDDAVHMILDLDETDEENFLLSNLRRDIEEDMKSGIPEDEARRRNSIRMFGSPPGNYGVGVDVLIDSSQWNDTKDLADAYINWSCYAYGRGLYGIREQDLFFRRFQKAQVTIKNMSDRETDIFDVDDVYTYLGGLNAFVRAYGNNPLYSLIGDDSDPDKTRLRSLDEECRYVFRSKVLNPRFLNGLREHRYAGAMVLMNISKFMIGWDGTSDSLDGWIYEKYCEKFIQDDDVFDWIRSVNPDAAVSMITNMFEASKRGFWKPSERLDKELRKKLDTLDGDLEEARDR